MRFEEKNICAECHSMGTKCATSPQRCKPVKQKLRPYNGIRLTADGFDCALPVTIDSHSVCSYECLYCFSDNIVGHRTAVEDAAGIGQTSLRTVENIFAGEGGQEGAIIREALKYDRRNKAGYPTPVQLGGLCDPGDTIEQNQGWLLKFIALAIKYNQPVRFSTKGSLFLLPEYQKAVAQAPHLFWGAFSIITDDDELLQRIDRNAPNATTRLKAMAALSKLGVRTSLRLRPIIAGVTDRNRAYISLIEKAAAAGATAISYEVGFFPKSIPKASRWKWQELEMQSGMPLRRIYEGFGPLQACTRPSYLWTEDIMHSIAEHARAHKMTIGVSDPVWKQLGETGCCCGILPTDKVFGNWEHESGTVALLDAKRTGQLIYFKDVCPPWALKVKASTMVNLGAGPLVRYATRHTVWADKLRAVWNETGGERSVMNYFQGALQPTADRDADGNMVYRYVGLKRQYKRTSWDTDIVHPGDVTGKSRKTA
jgi:DNA repair photolyase